jgi:hypothetical protein
MVLRLVWSTITAVIFFMLVTVSLAFAQGAGIGLRPISIDERLEPGITKTYEMTVSNLSATDQLYYLFARDISGATDSGAPIFASPTSEKTGHELADWITFETAQLDVPAGSERTFRFNVSTPNDAVPGSHFAGVFVSSDPPSIEQSGAAVGYQVAGIVSILIPGDVLEKALIRQFSTDNYVYAVPKVAFRAVVENSGNTLITPTGPLVIRNMFGREVENVVFNDSLGRVLPRGSRTFTYDWEGDMPGFGRYEAVLSLVYGDTGARQTISNSVVFWILPMNIIIPALGVLAFILLITFLLARWYVHRKLSVYTAVTSGRRLVRKRGSNSSAFVFVTITILAVTALFLLVLLVLFA